jgi:hypothetical protein
MKTGAEFIVKVQIPLVTTERKPWALIYNSDRSVEEMFPITCGLLKRLDSQPKSFWYAKYAPDPGGRPGEFRLHLLRKAPWQEW